MDKIVFKCAIGAVIGSGHVMRCLTLADEMQRTWPKAKIIFWVDQEGLNFPALKQTSYQIVISDKFSENCDLLIIDNYALDYNFEQACRTWARRIMAIDDLANRHHDCDVLLDQTYGRSIDDYKNLVPEQAMILCGANYAILRPEFAVLREKSLARRQQINHMKTILISLGSMNLNNVTGTILDIFLHIKDGYQLKIVLSSQAQYMDAVKQKISNIHMQTHHQCELLCDVTDMAQLMSDSDFAIGAGGTTSWERACLGLPSALVEIADNQQVIIQNLVAEKAIVSLGTINEFDAQIASNIFLLVANDPSLMHSLSKNSADICDGTGCQKIISYIKSI